MTDNTLIYDKKTNRQVNMEPNDIYFFLLLINDYYYNTLTK